MADSKISRTPITTSQMVALSYTYRLIFRVLISVPLLLVVAQSVFAATFFLLDTITNHHTIITVVSAVASARTIERQIVKSAPSDRQAIETSRKLQYLLPAVMLIPSILVALAVFSPLEDFLQIKAILTWSPPIVSLAVTLRMALGSLLLGCAVCARYVGPPSIVRCSSSPLAMNPIIATFRRISSSIKAFFGFAGRPGTSFASSPPGVKVEKPTPPPRRLQWPTFRAAFTQIIISIAFSIAVAFTSVLPFTHDGTHGDTPMKQAIVIVACVTNLANLLLTSLDGSGHEMNPLIHRGKNEWMSMFWSFPERHLRSLWVPGVVVLVVSYFGSADWDDFFVCILTAMVMAIHSLLFDSILRNSLCSTPLDIRKSIEESSGDGSKEVFLDVAIRSVCHSNNDLAKKLGNVSTTAIWLDLEQEEKKRNEAAISSMATTLLYKAPMDESGPHLEEDTLRLALVSSIGSWVGEDGADEWKTLAEPYFVPICRGLCAYFGGLGEALIQIAADNQNIAGQWLIPPGCVVLAEYSIQGATHCLLSAISSNVTTWRNSHLATLVPALLTSFFRLETGLLQYAQILGNIQPKSVHENEKIGVFRALCPQHLSLFFMVNNCSRNLLQKVSQETRRSEVLASCDRELLRWCDAKLDSIEDPR